MSVELQEQRVRYEGYGTAKNFPFAFTIEEPSQVQVVRADAKGTESTLVLNQDYSVALNADGTGSVNLEQALPTGFVLALVSNIEIDQERAFYNNTPYYQEQIEGGLDKLTRICQQLHELAMRHITVPATSSTKPDELLAEIFTAQRESIESAASAASSAAAAGASERGAAAYLAQTELAKTEAVAAIQAQQAVSESAVEQAGDAQAVRLEQLASNILVSGTAYNKEVTVILDQPIVAGTVVSLPVADDGQQMMYRVGASTLRMGFNGTLLFNDEQFEEVGNTGSISTSVKLLFDAEAGDVLNFFVYSQNVTVVVDEASGLSIDAQKRLSAAGIKAVADEAKEIAQTIQRMPMGSLFPYTGKDVPAGTLRADGTTYTDMRSSFPEFYEWVVNSGLTVPIADYSLVEGSCGAYGLDQSTGTVRMPTIAAGVFGTSVASQYGQAVQAGLPNISGQFSQNRFGASGVNATGPFSAVTHRDAGGPAGDSSVSDIGLTFDASKANPIYGRSDTVTPSHVKYPWVIVVYNAAVPPSVAQAGEFIEMLDKLATALPTGTVVPHAGNKDLNGYLLCNGAAVSRTTYAKLFEAIGTTYGEGDGSTTFNLPNLTDRFIQGSGTAGTVHEAGLPNIKGGARFSKIFTFNNGFSGALYFDTEKKPYTTGSEETTSYTYLRIDASKSSSIYGKSSTVQPPAVTMRYYIKY